MLREEINLVIEEYNQFKERLKYNFELFDIYEGNLLKYILDDVKKQVSIKSFESMQHRIVPINFLKKLIDKLSQIYNQEPKRSLVIPSESDEKLFEIYKRLLSIDVEMSLANEIFNLEKYVMIEPYVDDGAPALRVMQPDKFFVMSTDPANPTKVTHYIKIMGKTKDACLLHVYTDSEFLIIDSNGAIQQEQMNAMNNQDGVNFIGKIPAAYIARSKFDIVPRPDTDLLKMTKIMPILFSDLNEVIFWQSFGIIYGIDLGAENLTMAPNAFWSFKTDPNSQTKPSVGTIKPEADINNVMSFIMFQLNTWLNTRGIKSFAVADGKADISASGLSKMVDELDTSEDRKKQIPFFKKGESDLWNLIFNYMHPYWVKNNLIPIKEMFTPKQQAVVEFKEQLGIIDPMQVLNEIEKEVKLGLITRKKALMKKNPSMSEQEAEEYLKEIDEESTVDVFEDESNVDENKDQNTEKILS